jgi:hypothetical protein
MLKVVEGTVRSAGGGAVAAGARDHEDPARDQGQFVKTLRMKFW